MVMSDESYSGRVSTFPTGSTGFAVWTSAFKSVTESTIDHRVDVSLATNIYVASCPSGSMCLMSVTCSAPLPIVKTLCKNDHAESSSNATHCCTSIQPPVAECCKPTRCCFQKSVTAGNRQDHLHQSTGPDPEQRRSCCLQAEQGHQLRRAEATYRTAKRCEFVSPSVLHSRL